MSSDVIPPWPGYLPAYTCSFLPTLIPWPHGIYYYLLRHNGLHGAMTALRAVGANDCLPHITRDPPTANVTLQNRASIGAPRRQAKARGC